MPVDLEADSRDSDNNIFIFIIGIRATSRIKLFFYCVWTVPALLLGQRKVYDLTLRILIWQVHIPSFQKNVYVYCIIPISLFTTRYIYLFIYLFFTGKNIASTEAECAILWRLELVNGLLLTSVWAANITKLARVARRTIPFVTLKNLEGSCLFVVEDEGFSGCALIRVARRLL